MISLPYNLLQIDCSLGSLQTILLLTFLASRLFSFSSYKKFDIIFMKENQQEQQKY